MPNSFLPKLKKILWASFLISLPISNFRYFPAFLLSNKVNVRPLSIFPLFLLVIFVTLPGIWKRKLPKEWLPFLFFLILVVISTSLPLIQGFSSEVSEASVISRIIRTGLTLLIAVAIYFTISVIPQNEEDLKFTIRWLYAGMAIAILWGLLQTIFVLDLIPGWYKFMGKIQRHITQNVGTPNRVMGLTLEPSWFADQLTTMWLPWLLPAALMDKTIYKRRWGWLTIEKIFLGFLYFVLIFTLSRSGFVVGFVVTGFGVLFLRPKKERSDSKFIWLSKIRKSIDNFPPTVRFIIVSVGIFAVLAVIAAILFNASMQSKYIFRMWDYWLRISQEAQKVGARSLGGYFRYVGFGPRFIYWETAYRIFSNNPLFGVGLGNYTLHFQEMLPAVQVGHMPEILTRLVPGTFRIVTAKNFFARLLAETGIFGTAAFLSFLFSLGGAGLYLWLSKIPEERFWGAGSLLVIIGFLVGSFSFDSLAIPNPWVGFGLITAGITVYTQKANNESEN